MSAFLRGRLSARVLVSVTRSLIPMPFRELKNPRSTVRLGSGGSNVAVRVAHDRAGIDDEAPLEMASTIGRTSIGTLPVAKRWLINSSAMRSCIKAVKSTERVEQAHAPPFVAQGNVRMVKRDE